MNEEKRFVVVLVVLMTIASQLTAGSGIPLLSLAADAEHPSCCDAGQKAPFSVADSQWNLFHPEIFCHFSPAGSSVGAAGRIALFPVQSNNRETVGRPLYLLHHQFVFYG